LLLRSIEMSSPSRNEAAARHIPVAHQRHPSGQRWEKSASEARRPSETRLQVAVARQTIRDERDPYADVPCTD
jgi:hypothetical protein